MTPDFEVLIIGSGFGGLCVAIRLEQAGLGSYVVLEIGPDVGGTIPRACDFFDLSCFNLPNQLCFNPPTKPSS
jgi:cation diffusion facilitator CzcD-associated flavoprotein CzcO